MLAICSADKPVAFKAPKPSSNVERVPQGIKLGAKPGHKKHLTSLNQPFVSSKEATKGGSSKVPTVPKLAILRKEKILVWPWTQTQASLCEARANPQLSNGMSAFNLNESIYSASFIIHSNSASGNDASAASTVEADPGISASSDFVPQQQGMDEGTKNTSYDHLFVGTNPHVLAYQTKSVSKGLETILTQPITGKGASSVARQIEEETSNIIKLEDLTKLVSRVQPSFKNLNSPEDDPIIVVGDSDEDENNEVHVAENSQKHKLELEKNKTKAEAALLKAQPYFANVDQLKELLVKSLKTEFSNILSAHDFSSSLPTKLKDLPFKLNELTREVKGLNKQVHELEIKLPGDLKEIPTKLDDFTKNVTSSAQPEGEHIKKDKGKKVMSSKDAEEVSTESESDDETTHVPGFMVESSKKKELKKFDFVTESGEHVHLTKEQISAQIKIEEEAKAEAARREGEIRKEELIDLLGPEVVNKYYNDKLQYDRYCDKMLNIRAKSRIINCDILTRKGPITLKVYKEDNTSEIIPEFKANDLHL
ncbi:hypothetical protein Tco_0832418, partial [Tanacetum coccineum]